MSEHVKIGRHTYSKKFFLDIDDDLPLPETAKTFTFTMADTVGQLGSGAGMPESSARWKRR